tara:strand:- start:2802 stop:3062 length:261 start_codon:yes stop_codon:yes gene_type:complete
MLINIVYILIALILLFVIFIAVKAINVGIQAKNNNKIENDFSKDYNIDTDNIPDQILKLEELYKSGTLTKEEFEKAKDKVLNDKPY